LTRTQIFSQFSQSPSRAAEIHTLAVRKSLSPSSIAEGTLEQLHVFLPGHPFNADYVEAIVNIMEVISTSVFASDPANLLLLGTMHGLFRTATHLTRPGLHLDERERVTIPTDEIHLAEALSIVARNDLVAVLTEVAISAEFAGRASFALEGSSFSPVPTELAAPQRGDETRVKVA